MTFEEWWDTEVATQDTWVEDLCRSAWKAGFKQCRELINTTSYVLVPVEPTEKMLDAWWRFKAKDEHANINDMWEVMIAAAQEDE